MIKKTCIDRRGKEYDLEINENGTVNIFSSEGFNLNVEISGNALHMLEHGECEYPLDVDEWDEWMKQKENDWSRRMRMNS